MVASLLGMLAGYIACFLWGWPLAQKLTGQVPAVWQWPLAAGVIFMGAALLCQLLARPFVQRFKQAVVVRVMGAGLNAALGGVMFMAALWALGLFVGTSNRPALQQTLVQLGYANDHPWVIASNQLMAFGVSVGLRLIGASTEQINASNTLMQTPTQSIVALQNIAGSAATQTFLHSPSLQNAMAAGDINAIARHPDFAAFTAQPAMSAVMALVPRKPNEPAPLALAGTLLAVWQKVDHIKQSPQVQAALADPEIQALMQQGDNARLMTHPKMQPILGAVMAALGEPAMAPSLPVMAPANVPAAPITSHDQAVTAANEAMFKWFDAAGQVHFSTWDRIPKGQREGAELINL